jgi:CheY-like chemotaxis protein
LVLILTSTDSTPEEIVTDPTRMRQVLINLLNNALKFTKVGSITITLSGFEDSVGKKFCAFDVQDTGVGIPPDLVDRLFKAFTQADSSITRRYGGTGLGLALSRSLARAMGGDVRILWSEKDRGSLFRFSVENQLHLIAGDFEAKRKSSNKALPPNALRNIRVLLVEDSADNQTLIWRYLSKQGASVEIADNGLEGMRKALESNHDVVLMDMQMPIMDGYTATANLRAQNYEKPIIALTAHAMADISKKCRAIGCTDFLSKPINARELVDTILRHTSHAGREEIVSQAIKD